MTAGGAAAVIVAAGGGRRLGGAPKALLRAPGGDSFLAAIAAAARGAGAGEIVVVTGGPHRAPTEVEAARLGLAIAVNPETRRGMGSSVAVGFAFARAVFSARAALLWPVDHPCVRVDTVAALLAAASPDRAVSPRLAGRGGHPVAAGRRLWPELAACGETPGGAREVLRRAPNRLFGLPVGDPGVVADVDTAADRARLFAAEGGAP